jgi:rhodanese-related sulfurtransferase
MKKFQKLTLLSTLSLFAVSAVLAKEATHQPKIQDSKKAVEFFEEELSYKTNPHGVKAVLDGTVKNVTIVDVRSAADFAKGHIPGAVNVPWEKHDSFDGGELVFPELRKDGFNYVYCYTGVCNLSQKAAKKFASLGYPVKEIVGGYAEWVSGNNPVEK